MSAPADYANLLARLRQYRDERDWGQFHTPAKLAMAVTVEAGELLEHFLWEAGDAGVPRDPASREELSGEVADVAIYLLFMCDALGVDLLDVVERKLERNLTRHPVQTTRGRARPGV